MFTPPECHNNYIYWLVYYSRKNVFHSPSATPWPIGKPEGITNLKTQVIIQKEDCLRGFER
jgi:hypothetical protein